MAGGGGVVGGLAKLRDLLSWVKSRSRCRSRSRGKGRWKGNGHVHENSRY